MNRRYILPIAALVFALMFGAGLYVINLVEEQHLVENRRIVAEIGQNHAAALQHQMVHSLSATYALAALLRQSGGHLENFDSLAADIIRTYGGISNLQLAPDAVVSQIYPLEGNDMAVGHDLLADENRQPEVLKAIESGRLTLAGPFELIQGGTAMVGRLPIFMEDETGLEKFWGFSTALIWMPAFIEASGLDELAGEGYRYQLARSSPDTGEMEVLLPAQNPLVDFTCAELHRIVRSQRISGRWPGGRRGSPHSGARYGCHSQARGAISGCGFRQFCQAW